MISAGTPSTCTTVPLANAFGRSLGPSTKKEPSSPCGFPTLPIGTRSESNGGEVLEHVRAALLEALGPLVRRLPVLEVEGPVRARLVVVGPADAAGVDDALAADRPLELHVRVPADDDVGVDVLEQEGDALLGRALREDVEVVARRRVHVEDAADLRGRRVAVEELDLLVGQRCARLVQEAGRSEAVLPGHELAVGVAADPEDPVAERAQALERLRRLRAARDDVTADDDGGVLRNLGQHGIQRGEIAVDVVQRRYQPTISSWRRRPAFGPPARTSVRSARASRP